MRTRKIKEIPGTREQHLLKPGQIFQVFRGEIELDVFYEKGQWKIVTNKEVLLLEKEQVGAEGCTCSKGKRDDGVRGGTQVL